MAIPAIREALFQMIDAWAAVVAPVAARDPAAFFGNDINMAGLIARLRAFIDDPKWSDSLVIRVTNSDLVQHTARLNQMFGTRVAAPQFQAAPVTPLSTSAPLTAAQVAAFGPGVALGEIDRALLEAAAALDPESSAAEFIRTRIDFVPTSLVSSQAETVGPAQTFAEIVAESGSGPAPPTEVPLSQVRRVAIAAQDAFISSESTLLPVAGGPSGSLVGGGLGEAVTMSEALEIRRVFGINLGPLAKILGGAVGSIIPGVGTAVGAAVGSALFGGTGPAKPEPTLPTALVPVFPPSGGPARRGVDPGALRQVLDVLKAVPPTAIPAQAAELLFGGLINGRQPGEVQIGLNGSRLTTGMPFDTVQNAVQTVTYRAPKGFVVVEIVGSNGLPVKVAMWKPQAIALKLWKRRPKARITAAEYRTLKTANRVAKKAKVLAQDAGFSCVTKGSARRSRKKVC